jgi:energy-coupling factor transport system ATP-binding protein
MPLALSVENLSFSYAGGRKPALKEISARVEDGSSVCIMGHGGAGKSSLCYSFNALVPRFFRGSYSGRVLIKGKEAARQKTAHLSKDVGLVLQDFESQLFSTNVELEMAFGPENHGLPPVEIKKRIEKYLASVGLEHLSRRQPATLSGGQKQRLAIGSILTMEPHILVLDEPTTDLDPGGAEEVLAVAQSLRQEGRTLVMVAPEPEMALDADQVWLMHNGEIIAQGPPGLLLTDLSKIVSCGIKPPALVELFQAMGWPGSPLSMAQALSLMERYQLIPNLKHPLPAQSSRSSSGPPILEMEDLEYLYPSQGVKALQGITLTIHEGEFVALLGQNGSGKTTLAMQCNGLLTPTSGRIRVQGRPTKVYSHRDMAQKVGYIFQNPDHQIFARTVEDEIGFGLKVQGLNPDLIHRRVAEALDVVELQGYERQIPFTLTKGERQRVAVASVLAVKPQVIILDEPTTGLDYRQQRRMMELLKQLNQKGHTIIIITHSMWVAAEYAGRTIVLKRGAIIADGPTRRVFADEDTLAGASLLPPPLVRLSNHLGLKALTLEQMIQELKG